MSTELAIRPDQTSFDDKQLAALRALGVQNAPAADVALLFHQAARTGLDPFARQIYLIGRGGKYTIQTGIDGFRVIRDRAKTYRGHTEEWCGPDGKWRDVWLDQNKPPAAARVAIHVDGYDVPIIGIARWSEYAQESSPTWKKMPGLMLAKCAEALALRKAYPQDLSGLYTDDEIPTAETGADGVPAVTQVRGPQWDGPAWEAMISRAATLDTLRAVFDDATRKGFLDHTLTDGSRVREAIFNKKNRLEQDLAAEKPTEPEPARDDAYDDEVPF